MASDGEQTRQAFALPPIPPGSDLGDDIVLDWLDPTDPDERSLLIRAAHPAMHAALDRGEDEVVVGDQPVDIRLHLAMHEMVAQQLFDDDPAEVWQTAQRLTSAGYDHHEVLHMLGGAVSPQIWHALHDARPYDRAQHVAALHALPGAWDPPPPPRPTRAAHAEARRRTRRAQRAARRRNRRR